MRGTAIILSKDVVLENNNNNSRDPSSTVLNKDQLKSDAMTLTCTLNFTAQGHEWPSVKNVVLYNPQNIRIEKGKTKHTVHQTIVRFQTENIAILLWFEY